MINSLISKEEIKDRLQEIFNQYLFHPATRELAETLVAKSTLLLLEAFPEVDIQLYGHITPEINKINLLGRNPETIEIMGWIGSMDIKM